MSVAALTQDNRREDRPLGPRALGSHSRSVVAAGIGAVALFTDWSGLSLLVVLVLASPHMPAVSAVRRAGLSVLVLLSVNAVVLTLLAVMEVRSDARYVTAMYLLVGALASGRRVWPRQGLPTDRLDLWGLASFVITFAVLARPLVGAPVERLSALLAHGTDGGSHLSLVRAVIREGGYIGLLPNPTGVHPGMEGYPSGWAGIMSLVLQLLLGPESDPNSFLLASSLLIAASYALLALFATVVALDVARAAAAAGHLSNVQQCVGFVCVLATRGQRIGDLAAGSRVVRR